MKVKYEIVQKRRDDIMLLIQKLGTVSVEQLSKEFSTSDVTIRRDLQYWESKGAIQRTRGGARLIQRMVNVPDVNYNNDRYLHAIAKYAALFVEDGDTIFINTSYTALLMIHYIRYKSCTVITNNAAATQIQHDDHVKIVLTGGELNTPQKSRVGDIALSNIRKVLANKCFLGCSGITAEDGITTAIMAETTINEMMLQQTTGKRCVVCDHTKVGLKHSFITGSLANVDTVITDIAADKTEISKIESKNVEVVCLEPLLVVPQEDTNIFC